MAHIYQDARQRERLGDNAPWFCRWRDKSGKLRAQKIGAKTHAKRFKAKVESELAQRTYDDVIKVDWSEFRNEYETTIVAGLKPRTQVVYRVGLDHFERLIKPKCVADIATSHIDMFKALRRRERGEKKGSKISASTINNDLRTIRTALRRAKKWKYIREVPEFDFLKEPTKLKRYVTEEHFQAIYEACHVAQRPERLPFSAEQWWQSMITFAYLTGWRINELLTLLWEDIDLEAGTAITRWGDNKGGREERVPLHPIIVEHLAEMRSLSPEVFPWPHARRAVWDEFHVIQQAADIHLSCREDHEHSDGCHVYGFHDFRRAFASVTGLKLDPRVLQTMMRHKAFSTTQRYIDMRPALQDVTESLNVPASLARKAK